MSSAVRAFPPSGLWVTSPTESTSLPLPSWRCVPRAVPSFHIVRPVLFPPSSFSVKEFTRPISCTSNISRASSWEGVPWHALLYQHAADLSEDGLGSKWHVSSIRYFHHAEHAVHAVTMLCALCATGHGIRKARIRRPGRRETRLRCNCKRSLQLSPHCHCGPHRGGGHRAAQERGCVHIQLQVNSLSLEGSSLTGHGLTPWVFG